MINYKKKMDLSPNAIKRKIFNLAPEIIQTVYWDLRTGDEKDRIHCFGPKNPDKIFYVFRVNRENAGIFTITLENILFRLKWALNKGYVPIFDFQNYRPVMLEDNHTLNLWYRYFAKADDYYALEEVYQSKKVIISRLNSIRFWQNSNTKEGFEKYNNTEIRCIFNKYLLPSEEVRDYLSSYKQQFLAKEGKILGVAVRECYRYVAIKENDKWHPRVKSFEEQCDEIDKYMNEWGCDFLFLMCDDYEFLEKSKKKYGDKLLYVNRSLPHFFKNNEIVMDLDAVYSDLKNTYAERVVEYMAEIELLAMCDCIVSNVSSAVKAALLRNDGQYEHVSIQDWKIN